ncbi:MAG TPA: hypothetical protein VF529_13210 [Solirubrobacteraceae bacterium]|jgi:hypothetical protein
MRRLLPSLLVLLAASAGVAGGTVLVPTSRDEVDNADLEPGDRAPRVYRIAEDPSGREPGWGVRVYESGTGLGCVSAGRVDDAGRFGRVDAEGRLIELPSAPDGACADLAKHPLALSIRRYASRAGQPARGVVYGVVARPETVVELDCGEGGRRALDTRPGGAFLAVDADPTLTGCVLTVTPRDGDARSYELDE